MIDENALHGMGRVIESAGGGITLQIEKKAEMAGELKAYIHHGCPFEHSQWSIDFYLALGKWQGYT